MNDLSDLATGMIVIAIVIVVSVGAALRHDIAAWLRAKTHKAQSDTAMLAVWPTQGQILPCQSWVGKEIEASTPPLYIAEADEIFAQAWLTWGSERAKEHADD